MLSSSPIPYSNRCAGWLIDVIGLKLGFMICAGLWALACLMHAGGNWVHLALLRFFMGGAGSRRNPSKRQTIGEWFQNQNARSPQAGQASVFHRCHAGPTDYLFCPRFIQLAGCIYVHWHPGDAVGWCCGGRSITARDKHPNSAKPSWFYQT